MTERYAEVGRVFGLASEDVLGYPPERTHLDSGRIPAALKSKIGENGTFACAWRNIEARRIFWSVTSKGS